MSEFWCCHLSEKWPLSLVRIVFSVCCHLSESFFSVCCHLSESFFQYVITCPNRFSVCCHLSETFFQYVVTEWRNFRPWNFNSQNFHPTEFWSAWNSVFNWSLAKINQNKIVPFFRVQTQVKTHKQPLICNQTHNQPLICNQTKPNTQPAPHLQPKQTKHTTSNCNIFRTSDNILENDSDKWQHTENTFRTSDNILENDSDKWQHTENTFRTCDNILENDSDKWRWWFFGHMTTSKFWQMQLPRLNTYPWISMDIHAKMAWIWIWIWMGFFISTASLSFYHLHAFHTLNFFRINEYSNYRTELW